MPEMIGAESLRVQIDWLTKLRLVVERQLEAAVDATFR